MKAVNINNVTYKIDKPLEDCDKSELEDILMKTSNSLMRSYVIEMSRDTIVRRIETLKKVE